MERACAGSALPSDAQAVVSGSLAAVRSCAPKEPTRRAVTAVLGWIADRLLCGGNSRAFLCSGTLGIATSVLPLSMPAVGNHRTVPSGIDSGRVGRRIFRE